MPHNYRRPASDDRPTRVIKIEPRPRKVPKISEEVVELRLNGQYRNCPSLHRGLESSGVSGK